MLKKCSKCGEEKEIILFRKNKGQCLICYKAGRKIYRSANKEKIALTKAEYHQANKEEIHTKQALYREEHKEEIAEKGALYYQENRELILAKGAIYREENRETLSEQKALYYQDNKEIIKNNVVAYQKHRRQNDPLYKLRKDISRSVNKELKKNGLSKEGESIKKYLPYTIEQLKEHIQNQFEWWMTWENQGIYDKKIWNDLDSTTWTWQLDHVIPHSTFHYTSMEDQAFKDCWALSNLRPLNAKQNIKDGNRR